MRENPIRKNAYYIISYILGFVKTYLLNYFVILEKWDVFWLTKGKDCVIICRQLCRTAARYCAERYYREESPGFAGQDS